MKIILFSIIFIKILFADEYLMPPTSSSYGYVGVISDEMMEKCIKIYNKTLWLENDINSIVVDRYSSVEVNNYNLLIQKHTNLINWFNLNCAGKQSLSACQKTQELNKKQGLQTNECRVGR